MMMQYYTATIILLHLPFCLSSLQSCFQSIAITGLGNSCSRTDQSDSESNATAQWQCYDLQSALVAAVELSSNSGIENLVMERNCVSIVVPPGDHLVTGPVHFGAASVYVFGSGERSEDVSISCNYTVDVDESRIFDLDYNYTDYTFYFNRSEVVSLEMVQFFGCPYPLRLDTVAAVRIHNSTFRNFTEAVFDIYNCASVLVADSTFVNNSGTGISRHSFRANTGAVSIGYNNIPAFNVSQIVTGKVSHCTFINNRAMASRNVRSSSSAFFSQIFSGRGGAIGVFYNESYYNITVMILDNYFESNYARSFGGAVFFVFFGEGTQNINILERNCFINNFALLGGGAIISTFFSNGISGKPHSVLIYDCTFIGNMGQTGGALFAYPAYELFGVSLIRCKRCNFTKNRSINSTDEYGAAVAIYLGNQFGSRESAPTYEFIDCTFKENQGNNGIFTVAYAPVSFNGTTKFIGSRGTDSLKIIGSLINFLGEVEFINNSDHNAVAMHLLSFGQIKLFSGLQMTFKGNIGTFGASILVEDQSTSVAFGQLAFNPQCFIVYEDPTKPPGQWNNASLQFRKNIAVLGSSLLISHLDACSWVSFGVFNGTFLFDWPIWDYGNDSINTGYMDPHNIEHSVATTVSTFRIARHSVEAWPGQKFLIELTGWDQFSQPTTASARLLFTTNVQEVKVNLNPEVIVIVAAGENSTLIKDFTLTYSISSGDALTDSDTLGTITVDETFSKAIKQPAMFMLHPLLCPSGYVLVPTGQQQGGLECQCEKNDRQIINCEDDQDTIIVEEGHWGAAVMDASNYHYDLFLYPCPPGYCKCSQNTSLGPSSCAFTYTNSDPDAQCVCGRQGILCGECQDGKGVSALLNNCVSCHSVHGLLLLALIIADGIAFVILYIADTPLPEWVYPFIFYIQVAPYVALYFSEDFITAGRFLYFASSALDFYFAYDFCLYSNMSPLVSYFIRYSPVLVALLLSPVIYIARIKKLLVVKHHGIWWIILMVYAHMVHTSMSILECPFFPDHKFPRWFVNGNIGCFTGWHVPLALLAVAVLAVAVMLVPLVCLISTGQHLVKSFYWWKYFQDPLTAAYKEKWRWWSAVELARRFIFILFVVSYPRNSIPPLLIMCITLSLYGFIQPYKSLYASVVEVVVQINFILLLSLESTSFFRDAFPSLGQNLTIQRTGNGAGVCTGEVSGHRVTPFTAVLLSFYFAPLLLFIMAAGIKLILYIRNKKEKKNQVLKKHSSTVYCAETAITSTEVYIEVNDDSV